MRKKIRMTGPVRSSVSGAVLVLALSVCGHAAEVVPEPEDVPHAAYFSGSWRQYPEPRPVTTGLQPETRPSPVAAARDKAGTGEVAGAGVAGEVPEGGALIIGKDLKVGMSLNEAMGLLGMPEGMRITGSGGTAIHWLEYSELGVSVGSTKGGKQVEGIEITGQFRGELESGLRMGQSYMRIIEKYGMPAQMTREKVRYPERGLILGFEEEKLATVVMTPGEPEAEPGVEPELAIEPAQNKAVRIQIFSVKFADRFGDTTAPPGKRFAVLDTRWENVHPRQRVRKDKLERRTDLTKGIGGLGMRRAPREEEYVEVDVPYRVNRLLNHVYLLADGLAYPLHEAMGSVAAGPAREDGLRLEKRGDIKQTQLIFTLPSASQNLEFHFFDYANGHIPVPIQGDPAQAREAPQP